MVEFYTKGGKAFDTFFYEAVVTIRVYIVLIAVSGNGLFPYIYALSQGPKNGSVETSRKERSPFLGFICDILDPVLLSHVHVRLLRS